MVMKSDDLMNSGSGIIQVTEGKMMVMEGYGILKSRVAAGYAVILSLGNNRGGGLLHLSSRMTTGRIDVMFNNNQRPLIKTWQPGQCIGGKISTFTPFVKLSH